MNPHQAAALARRQHALVVRSSVLRGRLAADAAVLQRPLALLDSVRNAWQWLRAHPEGPLAALVVVAVLRPRRAWRWGLRLWWGWRSLKRLQRWRVGAP
ncbi:MAG: YqjK family protein [Rubrivivax sp.]|nr:YqjK family protein [Rubrivivax sp.]